MLELSQTVRGFTLLRPSFLFLSLWLISGAVQAGEAPPSPGFAASVAQMLLGLGAVIVLLLLTLWLIKRLSAPRGSASHMKVLGAVAVGPRERVVLLDVAGTVLVLGVTGNSVRTLHTVDAQSLPVQALPASAQPAGGDFAAWLKKSLERRRHET